MKRFLSTLIIIAMLMTFSPFIIPAFSESFSESDVGEFSSENIRDILKFSCTYNPENGYISINGTMEHDAVAQHINSTIEIYEIPAGRSEYEVASSPNSVPVAKTSASMKFDFTFTSGSLSQRYSRYAIFLRSKEGKLTLGTEAQFAEVEYQPKELTKANSYKGISTSNAALISDINADTAIIPVYLNMLLTESSSGYIYRTDDKQYFFDKAYIDTLDGNVNSASAAGAKVYLRFLLGVGKQFGVAEAPNAEYILPNIYDEQTLIKIHSVTDFLVGRYENIELAGLILGKGWENRELLNYSVDNSFLHYLEKSAFYAATVANTARSIIPSAEIVLPFTSEGFFASKDDEQAIPKAKAVIEGMLKYFADTTEKGFEFSLMVEGDDVPFGITNDNISEGVDMSRECEANCFCPRCQKSFSEYLSEIKSKYSYAPSTYMYVWSLPRELSGNALSAAYAYSYHELLSADKLICFAVSFFDTKRNEQKLYELSHILKYIDTSESSAVTKNVLSYFGKSSWREVVGIISMPAKTIHTLTPSFKTPSGCIGHFSYFDFSTHMLDPNWLRGVGCTDIKTEYTEAQVRALRAELSQARADLIYRYEKYENFKYAPYLEFDIMLADGTEGSKYELVISFGSGNVRFEASAVVLSGARNSIVLDLTRVNSNLIAEDLKISVRPLETDTLEHTVLWLYDVEGHSSLYTSERLEELIGKERENIDHGSDSSENGTFNGDVLMAIAVILLASVLGIAAIMLFKRDRSDKNENDDEEYKQ